MNQKEEKWEPEFDQTFAKDFFSANCTCGAFHATKLKKFIKERFLYKPDLIALVEGMRKKTTISLDAEEHERGKPIGYNNALNDILAALKDTLSNKE